MRKQQFTTFDALMTKTLDYDQNNNFNSAAFHVNLHFL
jgi:hypothetical protein